MFRLAIAAGVAWALALSAASAADKPEVAAPEAWVRPPPKTPAPPAASAGAATADLIEDQQQHFDGREEALYYAYQVKALNAEGLQALGTVSMQWSPATDRLVIHHIRILRGDQVIDALPKDGGFNVARREDKLDSEGILDGDLSIILPLEGLQVGDVVDVAFTVHHLDPILKGRVDRTTAIGGGAPAAFARIRLSWPQSDAVHWRASTGMPEPHVTNVDGYTEAEVQLENPAPIVKPKGAPARFQHDRELSVSSYQSWQEVSQSMAPLYAAAATLSATSPVKAEAAAIAARTSDPEERASAALALVEDRIRYLAQTLGEGGLKPNAADDTWTHRYGDCKAKTALLLALLTELGIRAEPILVSTTLGEDLDTRLPSLSFFDHVMVHTVIGGRDRWLDGTRSGDEALAALETPSYGFVLPVRAEGAGLLKIAREPAAAPQILTVLKLDASKGVLAPASAHAELTLRGDLATAARVSIGALSAADRDKALRTYWKGVFDSMIVSSTSAAFDAKTGEAHLVADGEAKLDWSGGGFEPPGAVVGLKLDIERDADAVNPDAPFAIRFPFYVAQEVTLIMPGQGKGYAEHGDTLDRQLGGYELKREATIKDGVFRMRASMRALAPEIPFAEAKAAAEPLAQLARTTLRLRPPANAAPPSSDDLQTLLAATPSDAAGYAKRGNALYAAARYREAIRDYDQALALDPKLAWVMGNRALSHARPGGRTRGRLGSGGGQLHPLDRPRAERLRLYPPRPRLCGDQGLCAGAPRLRRRAQGRARKRPAAPEQGERADQAEAARSGARGTRRGQGPGGHRRRRARRALGLSGPARRPGDRAQRGRRGGAGHTDGARLSAADVRARSVGRRGRRGRRARRLRPRTAKSGRDPRAGVLPLQGQGLCGRPRMVRPGRGGEAAGAGVADRARGDPQPASPRPAP